MQVGINTAAKNVFQLVNNLLEWSRVQMENETLNLEQIKIKEITDTTINVLQPIALNKGIILQNSVCEEQAFADPYAANTIIRNLISNALKFTREDGTVEISARTDGNMTEISVSDTGTGVDEQIIDKLFTVEEKTTTKGTGDENGTGLGLPLCADLIKKHGGRIWVESTLGQGSTFRFTLPASQD